MADNLKWRNKHFVLFRHFTLEDAIKKEKYKLRPDLKDFAPDGISAQDFLLNLVHAEKYKEACDFLAYVMHRRAAIWWGYRCLLTLQEELDKNPEAERDIADIGAPKKMPIPDWAKPLTEEDENAQKDKVRAQIDPKLKKAQEDLKELEKQVPPEIQKMWDDAMSVTNELIKEECGYTLEELVKAAAEKSAGPSFNVDASPIINATEKLKADIEAKRKETVDLIKSVIPPKMPDQQKKLRDNAMQAIYRWVTAPDEINSQAALDIANECPDQPAGLMAMAAFWSFGDLMPGGKEVVPTPAGLAANGICASLLQAGLAKGGFRNYNQRCKLYMELGLSVAWGEDNWGKSLEEKEAPHERIEMSIPKAPVQTVPNTYHKWTPDTNNQSER